MAKPFKSSKGYICYIDESGDEGFRFDRGSSEWFVLSALVNRQNHDDDTTSIIDAVKKDLAWPQDKHLHWRKLRHLEKKRYAEALAEKRGRLIVVCVHKPSIIEREKFQERYRLYYYTARYLIERVTWHIRDSEKVQKEGDGKVGLVFSNRAGMSYKELCEYLNTLKTKTDSKQDVRIEWKHLDVEDVCAYPPGRLKGLQLADAVAGAFYNAIETVKTKGHMAEYAQIIMPRLYNYKGNAWGNGLKIAPREAVRLADSAKELDWIKKIKK